MLATSAPEATGSPEQALHELKISLIELEMQNEELRRTRDQLETEQARYLDYYDLAPVGYLTIGAPGMIQELNLEAAALLGAPRGTLVDQPISRFIHPEDQDIYQLHSRQLLDSAKPQAYELRLITPDGAPLWVRLECKLTHDTSGFPASRVVLRDISEYKVKEEERELIVRLIHSINEPGDLHQGWSALTSSLQRWSGCEAVGIRLRSGDDFPYYESCGFPSTFLLGENYLCAYGPDGNSLKDSAGNPVLECLCGRILSGSSPPSRSGSGAKGTCYTARGSFWSNNTAALDRPAGYRNRCFRLGYESVALIPLRAGELVCGLLQFNDHRPGRFTPSLIRLLEKIADDLALSISRRQAEEALVQSENALEKSRRLLAETEAIGKVGGWEFDIGTGKQTWTDEVYRIIELDLSYDPTVEKGIEFYTPASRTVITRALQRIIECGETFDVEVELTTAKGNLRSVHVIGKADLEHHRIYGFFQDITERKRAEGYREMAREVLKIINYPGQLDELFPQVLAALKQGTGFDAVGMRLQDGDDFPYFFQQGFSGDFLLAENSVIERSVEGGVCRDREGNLSLECTCGLVISGKSDPANPFFTAGGSFWTNDSLPLLELPGASDPRLHPRNECIHRGYASVALVPIRDGGRIVGLIQFNDRRKDCFTPDTVERLEEMATYLGAVLMRKRLEEEKLALQQQFQDTQKLESLGVMAGGIAHDFNNLLMVVTGHCSLARLAPGLLENSLCEIEKASQRAAELCTQMLAYAGKSQSVPSHVDLNALLDEMVRMSKSALKPNVAVKLELSADNPVIEGDAGQLRQVVMNLIINAAEAIGENQGEIRVSLVRTEIAAGEPAKDHLGKRLTPGCYLMLEVSDTGCGIGPENMRRIFEPFYSTKFAGRGLGLSATLGIVNSHGGALQLSSQPGQGTCFRVYLPIQVGASAAEKPLPAAPAPWRGRGTILLVEDEARVRSVTRRLLEALGFGVIEATNGCEALESYRSNAETITLVLTDMGMPVMDGYQLFHELKKLDRKLPIIISSGFGDDTVTAQLPSQALAGLLGKPYTLDQLRGVLKGVLG